RLAVRLARVQPREESSRSVALCTERRQVATCLSNWLSSRFVMTGHNKLFRARDSKEAHPHVLVLVAWNRLTLGPALHLQVETMCWRAAAAASSPQRFRTSAIPAR